MPTTIQIPRALEKGTLRIIPLGGLGEIGRNMTVYELDGKPYVAIPSGSWATADMISAGSAMLPEGGHLFVFSLDR